MKTETATRSRRQVRSGEFGEERRNGEHQLLRDDAPQPSAGAGGACEGTRNSPSSEVSGRTLPCAVAGHRDRLAVLFRQSRSALSFAWRHALDAGSSAIEKFSRRRLTGESGELYLTNKRNLSYK